VSRRRALVRCYPVTSTLTGVTAVAGCVVLVAGRWPDRALTVAMWALTLPELRRLAREERR
jgi:hypothetical protein